MSTVKGTRWLKKCNKEVCSFLRAAFGGEAIPSLQRQSHESGNPVPLLKFLAWQSTLQRSPWHSRRNWRFPVILSRRRRICLPWDSSSWLEKPFLRMTLSNFFPTPQLLDFLPSAEPMSSSKGDSLLFILSLYYSNSILYGMFNLFHQRRADCPSKRTSIETTRAGRFFGSEGWPGSFTK